MPIPRRSVLLLAVSTALLTACSTTPASPAAAPTTPAVPAPTPSPSPIDPRPRLVAAAKALAKTNYKITESGGQAAVWQVHGPSRSLRITASGAETIKIGRDQWSKAQVQSGKVLGMGRTRGSAVWLHSRPANGVLMPDATAARLAGAATGLTETAPDTFTGSVPEKVAREQNLFIEDVPFIPVGADKPPKPIVWAATGTMTIRLDAQGRLAVLTVEVRSADGRTTKKVSYAFSDYGKVAPARKPPAKDVFELPELK